MQAFNWTSSTTQTDTIKDSKVVPLRGDYSPENNPIIEENVVEASTFPLEIKVPIYVNTGERVTIRLIKEKVITASTVQESFPQFSALREKKFQSSSTLEIEKRKESEAYVFLTSREKKLEKDLYTEIEKRKELESYVEELEEKINHLSGIINGKDSETEEVPSVQKDLSFKMINMLQNIGMIISLILSVIFVFTFFFSLWLPKTDSLFAFILSILGATIFYFDKLYRRSINK
jgi:hypothetical protein